jgi:hypothetical protein
MKTYCKEQLFPTVSCRKMEVLQGNLEIIVLYSKSIRNRFENRRNTEYCFAENVMSCFLAVCGVSEHIYDASDSTQL